MHDGRRMTQWDAGEVRAKHFTGLQVHLVVGEPERDLRNLRREFFDFDAVELVDVEAGQGVDFE